MALRDLVQRLLEEGAQGQAGPSDEPEVRIAIYDSHMAAPQVISLRADDFDTFIGNLAAETYRHSRERGGRIPFVVIREIAENLIHAYFRDAVVTILDNGNTIRVSDQGPGIQDKERALQPGYTTASREMRRHIKGVGSGLPAAKEQLAFLGGSLSIEDNLRQGTVITLTLSRDHPQHRGPDSALPPPPRVQLTPRQKKVILLIGEFGGVGPMTIAKELDISHSTAYRELRALESLNLIRGRAGGKRTLTEEGIALLGRIYVA